MDYCLDVRDGTHDTPAYVSSGVPLVTSKNLRNGEIDFSSTKNISIQDHNKISERSKVDSGDILFAMIGSIGNPVLYHGNKIFSIKNMALFKQIHEQLSMDFVLLWLIQQQDSMRKKASGGLQSFVSLNYLRKYLIPIPPMQEQHRIVGKLDALLKLV
jgi:type I restriction enzyme S subunit